MNPKYNIIKKGKYYTGITKDGHTMFMQDVVKDINNLQRVNAELEEQVAFKDKVIEVLVKLLSFMCGWHKQVEKLRWKFITDHNDNETLTEFAVMQWPQIQYMSVTSMLGKLADDEEATKQWAEAKAKEVE